MEDSNKRRDFIKKTAVAVSSMLLAPTLSSANSFFSGSPNNKVAVGFMGVNGRGTFLAKSFAALPNAEVAFICDVDANVLARTQDTIEKLTGKRPKGFTDVRKMLEVKEMDAMVIAAPDHWHAPAAILGLQAGKHVYVEKPCSHNPREGELLVQATAKYNRMVQMGSQRRTFSNVKQMIKSIHEGIIGRTYFARAWYTNNRKTIGHGKLIAPPAELNYDLWQGPAPRTAFRSNVLHYNWHWFWNWGTGESLNNGTHELDVIRWGLGVDYPTEVVSSGGRFHFQDDWETPDTQTITYKFANNTACTWEGRSCNNFKSEGSERGVVFYGDKGTIVYNGGNSYKVYDSENKLKLEVNDSTPYDGTNTVSPLAALEGAHMLNFIESIRGNEKLNAPILEGHKSTLLPQLGNISYRVGRQLKCDPANGHILNDKDAMKLWSREYEKGWEVKV
ncbi:Gfo/Idh/MocA family oxidoreductase [Pedobacter frigiditerrae]|uniref:Gfo/Idh/MocA family oxidoreductase n=1 Tax=Pedobacter frigiditerrae TaxID=2530452 RepID=A0A4V2MI22_9SPHI|nr:Gfo/Idh/MocA family oxidoreductase [Pedobacter frigiditerrae]TCC88696.1 Gfo/Idh/MocA family oxidoreductase [Pedobacter frigiditerrae]